GGQGLWCIEGANDPQRETILHSSILNGLSGNGVRALVEDRDGNIWVGNSGGLNRITLKKASSIPEPGPVRSVQNGPDGRVWVSMDGELVNLSPNGQRNASPRLAVAPGELPAIDVDERGILWMASKGLLTEIDRGEIRRWPLSTTRPLMQIETITS